MTKRFHSLKFFVIVGMFVFLMSGSTTTNEAYARMDYVERLGEAEGQIKKARFNKIWNAAYSVIKRKGKNVVAQKDIGMISADFKKTKVSVYIEQMHLELGRLRVRAEDPARKRYNTKLAVKLYKKIYKQATRKGR